MALAPGTLLGQRFRIGQLLARGAMGEVWSAKDEHTGIEVAVKTLREQASRNRGIALRFQREAELLARIRSPFVPTFYDAVHDDAGRLCLVTERLVGETLEDRLRRVRLLPLAELGRVVDQVLEGLRAAHEAGIVHRDLKPENVFLVATSTGETAKLIDFGISRTVGDDDDAEGLTTDGATVGSLGYMSPEQLASPSDVDARADLYALGAIVFRALTGALPFPDKAALGIRMKQDFAAPSLQEATGAPWPEPLSAFVARLLDRDPEGRFPDVESAANAWASAQSGRRLPHIVGAMDPESTATMTHSPRRKR